MQSNKGIMRLFAASMYVCMLLNELNAKDNYANINPTITTIAAVSRIYRCNRLNSSPLLAINAAQPNKLPVPVRPAVPLLLKSCDQEIPLSCPSQLNINGNISITDSKNVAITDVESLSDITVDGSVQISIPTGGSFTINGTPYKTSPISGLIIARNSQPGVRIDCSRSTLDFSYGLYIGAEITLDVQGNITMNENAATNSSSDVYGVRNDGAITASGVVTISANTAKVTSGNSASYGILNNSTIIASGDIAISGNQATNSNGASYGARNDGAITVSGNITMSANAAEVTNGDSTSYGVLNNSAITVSGGITMSSNSATGSNNAFGIKMVASGAVKVGGNFAITATTTNPNLTQNFDFSTAEITNFAEAPLSFAQFAITIDNNSYGSTGGDYSAMISAYPSIAVLNTANQQDVVQPPLSCPGTLHINGSISITESKNVAITVGLLSDITVDSGGAVQISIPTGGSLTINGTPYTNSPILGLIIAQNSTPGVRIDCDDSALSYSYGAYIGTNVTLDVQGDVIMNGNTTIGNNSSAYGVRNNGTIEASGNITANNNQAEVTSGSGFSNGVYNSGTITTFGAITISNNQGTTNSNFSAYGFYNATIGILESSNTMIITSNQGIARGTGNAYAIFNIGILQTTSTQSSISIDSNIAMSNSGFACAIYNQNIASIKASGGITINSNQAERTSGSGNINTIYNAGIIEATASGTISMENNIATNNSGYAAAVYNDNTASIKAPDGITISNNQGETTSGNSNVNGVYNIGAIEVTASGSISMEGNTAKSNGSGSIIGVANFNTIKTGGIFIISAVTTLPSGSNQNFNSTSAAITNLSNTALLFNQFTITINTDSYGSSGGNYTTMQTDYANIILLNGANQT